MRKSLCELFPRDAISNASRIIRETQDEVESKNTGSNGLGEKCLNFGIQAIVDVMVKCRWPPRTVGVENSSMRRIRGCRSKRGDFQGGWRIRCRDGRQELTDPLNGGSLGPKESSQHHPRQGNNFPIRWARVVPKGQTSTEEEESKDEESTHAHNIWVPFGLAEGTRHVVVAQIDFFRGIGDTKVPDPNEVLDKRLGKEDFMFSFLGRHVIGCDGIQFGTVGAITNLSSILARGNHQTLRNLLCVRKERSQQRVGHEAIGTKKILLHCFLRDFDVFIHGFVIPIFRKGSPI